MTSQWTKVTAGHYRHDETGVEIKRTGGFREHGVNVGVRWHLTAPTRGGSTLTIGTTRSLAKAKEWAEGENGIVEYRSREIAIAYAEALAMNASQPRWAPEVIAATPANVLCLRVTGAHVGHMKAVTAECREEESDQGCRTCGRLARIVNGQAEHDGPPSHVNGIHAADLPHAPAPAINLPSADGESEADELVHYWPAADGSSTDKQYGDLSACGVDIAKTAYTYGSPKWDEITCGQCLTVQPPVDIAKGGHLAARYDITPAGRDYLMATEVIEGSRVVGGMTGAGKTTDPVEAFYRALGQWWH